MVDLSAIINAVTNLPIEPVMYAASGFIVVLIFVLWTRKRHGYVRRNALLTPTEQRSFRRFEQAVNRFGHRLFAQVRIADVVQVKGGKGRAWWRKFVKISSKHVDFVVTNADFVIVAAIEVDDRSHEQKERVERDQFVDQVFHESGLPLIRVKPGYEQKGIDILIGMMR